MSNSQIKATSQMRKDGEQILNALRDKRTLSGDELQSLTHILDFNRSSILRIFFAHLLLGGSIVFLACLLEWSGGQTVKATFPTIFLATFLLFFLHFGWYSSGGRDCYAFQISNQLRCMHCRRKISGLEVKRMVKSKRCPHCLGSVSHEHAPKKNKGQK